MPRFQRRSNPFAYRTTSVYARAFADGVLPLVSDIRHVGPIPEDLLQKFLQPTLPTLGVLQRRGYLERRTAQGLRVYDLGPLGRAVFGKTPYIRSQAGLHAALLRRAVVEYARGNGGHRMDEEHPGFPHDSPFVAVTGGISTSKHAYVVVRRTPMDRKRIRRLRQYWGGEALRAYATIVVVTRSPSEARTLQRDHAGYLESLPIDELRQGTARSLKRFIP